MPKNGEFKKPTPDQLSRELGNIEDATTDKELAAKEKALSVEEHELALGRRGIDKSKPIPPTDREVWQVGEDNMSVEQRRASEVRARLGQKVFFTRPFGRFAGMGAPGAEDIYQYGNFRDDQNRLGRIRRLLDEESRKAPNTERYLHDFRIDNDTPILNTAVRLKGQAQYMDGQDMNLTIDEAETLLSFAKEFSTIRYEVIKKSDKHGYGRAIYNQTTEIISDLQEQLKQIRNKSK
jgi:hypothetical protein